MSTHAGVPARLLLESVTSLNLADRLVRELGEIEADDVTVLPLPAHLEVAAVLGRLRDARSLLSREGETQSACLMLDEALLSLRALIARIEADAA